MIAIADDDFFYFLMLFLLPLHQKKLDTYARIKMSSFVYTAVATTAVVVVAVGKDNIVKGKDKQTDIKGIKCISFSHHISISHVLNQFHGICYNQITFQCAITECNNFWILEAKCLLFECLLVWSCRCLFYI